MAHSYLQVEYFFHYKIGNDLYRCRNAKLCPQACIPSTIFRMEDQASYFNALPRLLVFLVRIDKRTVRNSPRPPVNLGVKAFDQCHFVRLLSVEIMPTMRLFADFGAGAYGVCLALENGEKPVRYSHYCLGIGDS